ncbi:hypothetical protein ACIF70_39260 [Actinacidiphila glaucinigra]|uniref:hypothetical protein n=1 Tax=Actinacidiphila glaucinigra TaxID=235986 RepID=UPI0037C79C33
MGRFEPYGGYKKDFDLHVGPANAVWDRESFGRTLSRDVDSILGVSLRLLDGDPGFPATAGRNYFWFGNDDLSVRLVVTDPEEGWPLDRVPALVCPISRSMDIATWQIAEKLYDGLDAIGTYLLIAFESEGMPIASNFEIGDDW